MHLIKMVPRTRFSSTHYQCGYLTAQSFPFSAPQGVAMPKMGVLYAVEW